MRVPDEHMEKKLDELLGRYRDACPVPESSPDFMPRLWERIESRNRFTLQFRRWAHGFLTAAAAASLVFGALQINKRPVAPVSNATYLESLADEQSADQFILQDVASVETHRNQVPWNNGPIRK